MAKLIYSEGGTEHEFVLDAGRAAYTIGRNPMCDLRINNPSISRKHAEVRLDAATGAYSVYDLNSSNGTYVNGTREQHSQLTDGDEMLCGEFKIYFLLDDDAPIPGGTELASPGAFQAPPPAPQPPPAPPGPSAGGHTMAGMPSDLMLSGEARKIAEAAADAGVAPPPPADAFGAPDISKPVPVAAGVAVPAPPQDSFTDPELAPDAATIRAGAAELLDFSGASAELERELKAVKAELKSLRLALQNESGRAAEAVQEKAKLAKDLARVEDDLLDAKTRADQSREQAVASEESVAELEAQLKKKEQEIAALGRDSGGAELEKLKADLKVATDRITQLESELARAGSNSDEAKRLKADLGKRGTELDKLKRELANAEAQTKELEKKLAEKTASAARFEGELKVARARAEELEGDAGAETEKLRQKNSAMKDAFKDLSAELQQLIQANRDLMAQLEKK